MKTYRVLLILSSVLLLALSLSSVSAHAELTRSDPAAGAVLDTPPSEVFAWFSQALSTGSKLDVFDGQFHAVDDGQTFIDASDATLIRIRLGTLAPGRYTVNWKATAVDGHVSSGSFDFTVREAAGLSPLVIGAAAGAVIIVLGLGFWLIRRARSARMT